MDYQPRCTVTKQQHASLLNNTNPTLFHNSDFREKKRVRFWFCVFAKTCKRAITAWNSCLLRNRTAESYGTLSIQTAITLVQGFIQMKMWLPGQTRAGDLKVKCFGAHRNDTPSCCSSKTYQWLHTNSNLPEYTNHPSVVVQAYKHFKVILSVFNGVKGSIILSKKPEISLY